MYFQNGNQCWLWISGKDSYICQLLKRPISNGEPAKNILISEVIGNGSIIKLDDGSILEVDSYDTFHTMMWLGGASGLLINNDTIISFTEDAVVGVERLK